MTALELLTVVLWLLGARLMQVADKYMPGPPAPIEALYFLWPLIVLFGLIFGHKRRIP